MKTFGSGTVLGVIGGGQLGRMFAIAAQHMGYQVIGYSAEPDSPLKDVCSVVYEASFEDLDTLHRFAKRASVVTIEFENIPVQALEAIQQFTLVRPGPQVLQVAQNRLREKTFLASNGYPIAPFKKIQTLAQLEEALPIIGLPAVLKTSGFGYDGKGQLVIRNQADASKAYSELGAGEMILERFVSFERELSIIGARNENGDFVAFGPIENRHKNHILDVSIAPMAISPSVAKQAIEITRSVMESFAQVGLLCLEFFLVDDNELLVNEMAPRPHNSGHLSIEGCVTSQFEQLVRAITGLPLGKTDCQTAAAMANLMGDLWADGEPKWDELLKLKEVYLHLYGKKEARRGRKMGHLTVCRSSTDQAYSDVVSARKLLKM